MRTVDGKVDGSKRFCMHPLHRLNKAKAKVALWTPFEAQMDLILPPLCPSPSTSCKELLQVPQDGTELLQVLPAKVSHSCMIQGGVQILDRGIYSVSPCRLPQENNLRIVPHATLSPYEKMEC